MTAYRIRGYTGRHADFDFRLYNMPVAPTGTDLRDAILANVRGSGDWEYDLDGNDIDFAYELGDDAERSDLRDTDSQRVWIFDSLYCNLDEDIFNTSHRCGEDGDGQGDDTECEHDSYMITVDIEGE